MVRKAEKIAHRARISCEKWREYFKINNDLYHMMHEFVFGQQWKAEEEDEMINTYKKVPLVCNKLAPMANQLLGEQQQNTPQLQVVPMSNCDEKTAHLRELIVKDIMFSGAATTTYQTAAQQAFIGCYSAFAWDTEYSHSHSFDQDIVPRYFKDATRTYFDIGAESRNKTDGEFCGYITRMTRSKFRKTYGKELEDKILKTMNPSQEKEEIALAVQPNQGEDPFTWADDESITIIHDYRVTYTKDTLYKMSNGNIYNQLELEDLIEKSKEINRQKSQQQAQAMINMPPEQDMYGIAEMQQQEQNPTIAESATIAEEAELPTDEQMMTLWDNDEVVRIEDKKEIRKSKIMHYKIAGDYVLEEGEFPSEQLPLVFVDCNSYYDKNGKQICLSFFGDCKDTQRYINYLRTQSAFILKISRYDQFMVSKKNVQSLDTQQAWRDPSSVKGAIPYDESPNGNKPEQLRPPELSQSLFQQFQLAIEDLYTCTGLYPTRMGNQGSEVSGAAIDARTRQGSYSTYVAFNSINKAIATGGEIVNEMIPRVYDAQRTIALMMPDEGMKNITINKQVDEYGNIENDIRKGTYQVRLKPGASYEGQKELALTSLKEILQANPQSFALIADLYADNLPLPNTIEIKNRLKTLVPPQIIEAGKTGKMPQETGQASPEQQAMQQEQKIQQAELQFKQQEMQLRAQEIELKKQQIMLDAQFKMQELENERLEIAGEIKEQEMRYLAETQRTESDNMISHADNLVKILTHKVQ